jgi:hypothetical protein
MRRFGPGPDDGCRRSLFRRGLCPARLSTGRGRRRADPFLAGQDRSVRASACGPIVGIDAGWIWRTERGAGLWLCRPSLSASVSDRVSDTGYPAGRSNASLSARAVPGSSLSGFQRSAARLPGSGGARIGAASAGLRRAAGHAMVSTLWGGRVVLCAFICNAPAGAAASRAAPIHLRSAPRSVRRPIRRRRRAIRCTRRQSGADGHRGE